MAPDRNNASQEQMKKTTQEEEEEIEMNDAGAVAVVDTSNSRDGLLCTLLRLKVSSWPPSSLFVLRKKLVRSYLSRNQNYLVITQTEYEGGFRRQGVLTDEEHGRVHTERGLPLRALDRRGVSYRMVLIQLAKTCRLRTGWGEFLCRSGVRQDDDTHVGDVVEIWAFRSTTTGLGLVLLHYTKDEDAQITAASSDDSSSDSGDQEAQCTCIKDQQYDADEIEKNCSPLDEQVVCAAAILVSMK